MIMDDVSSLHLKAVRQTVIVLIFLQKLLYFDLILLLNDSALPHAVACLGG